MLAAAAVALAGCGLVAHPGRRIPGSALTVYFGGALHGASSVGATAALNGARIALADIGGRIGSYRIALKALDDSSLASDGWDPNQTTLNARLVVQDPSAIGYVGDFNSGASAISIPLLNRAGIAQISPGSTAVGLTSTGPGAAPGEPQKYYPTGARTFARVVPTDATQGLALVAVGRMTGCASTFVLHDGEVDGEDAALSYALIARSAGLHVVGIQEFKRAAANYTSLAKTVANSGADCVLISAIDEPSSVLLTEEISQALPHATIFAGNGLADSAYTNPTDGGLPASLDPHVVVLCATLPPADYPASARAFLAQYTRRFGAPEPPALYGFAAMRLMLSAIASATDDGHRQADRDAVLDALFRTRRRHGVLGSFRLDRAGDVSIDRFGIYRLARGRMVFAGTAG